jgi:hypothetical protein
MEPSDASSQGRLAATGLADQPNCLATANLEADPVDRTQLLPRSAHQPARGDREVFDDVGQLQQRLR